MIRDVAKMTNFTFEEVYRLPAAEFFVYIRFINEERRREYVKQMKEQAQMRARMNRKR